MPNALTSNLLYIKLYVGFNFNKISEWVNSNINPIKKIGILELLINYC